MGEVYRARDTRLLDSNNNSSGPVPVAAFRYTPHFPFRKDEKAMCLPSGDLWRNDGRELFFIANNPGRIFAVDVETSDDGLRFGIPRQLFQFAERNPGHVTPFFRYAISPDGQRVFVAHVPAAADAVDVPLTIVLNWTSLLPRE